MRLPAAAGTAAISIYVFAWLPLKCVGRISGIDDDIVGTGRVLVSK